MDDRDLLPNGTVVSRAKKTMPKLPGEVWRDWVPAGPFTSTVVLLAVELVDSRPYVFVALKDRWVPTTDEYTRHALVAWGTHERARAAAWKQLYETEKDLTRCTLTVQRGARFQEDARDADRELAEARAAFLNARAVVEQLEGST